MTRSLLIFTLGGLLLAPSGEAQMPDAGQSYNAFRMVRTRNIFDPDRRGPARTDGPRPSRPATPGASYIAFTGAMVTGEKKLAFFSGSHPEYNKVIPAGESIADFKIGSIHATHVELERNGELIVVAIGRQLPLRGSTSEPAPSETRAPAAPAPADAVAPAAEAPPAAVPADKNELLKRMMERRRQETSR